MNKLDSKWWSTLVILCMVALGGDMIIAHLGIIDPLTWGYSVLVIIVIILILIFIE